MASARELTRLVGIQKSPIIHHFGESISGAVTIRGFEQQKRYMKTNFTLVDNYSRPFFHSFSAIEWLCLRMELLSTFVFAFSMVLLVSFPLGNIDPSKSLTRHSEKKLDSYLLYCGLWSLLCILHSSLPFSQVWQA